MSETEEKIRIKTAILELQQWYVRVRRELPWRTGKDPYHIWISEIMLQQTRISTVMDYYSRFISALPNISSLADVSEDELLKLWQGLGYYSRARNLQKAAKILVEKYGGQFPADYNAIRALPGIGDYTAGAIASIAFSIPVPAVDGNVLRVLALLTASEQDIAKESTKSHYRSLLAMLLPQDASGDVNEAIMELGETVCLPNGSPLCLDCPLCKLCRANMEDLTEKLPIKSKPRGRRIEDRLVYLFFHENCVALRKRPAKGLLAQLWEFPNALRSEGDMLSFWGIQAISKPLPIQTGKHIFSHIEWHMEALTSETKDAWLPEGWVWATGAELESIYAVPNAFQFVWDEVKKHLD